MKRFLLFLSLVPVLLASACASAEDRAARAQEEVANQRLELIQKHQECVEEANGDQAKIDVCETYLNEADALK